MLLALFAILVVMLVLVLDRAPVAGVNAAPSSADVRGARAVYEQVRMAQRAQGRQHIAATWAQIAAAGALAGRAAGVDRVAVMRDEGRMHAVASVPLVFGFWLNGHAFLQADKEGRPRIAARIGDLPVPPWVVHASIAAARQLLRLRGAHIEPFEDTVLQVGIDPRGVRALVDLPINTRMVSTLSGLRSDGIDEARVAAHYCRLVAAQNAEPASDFAGLVRRAFTAGAGTPADNRALFVAISLLVAGIDAGALATGKDDLLTRCGSMQGEVLLQGRADLVKHWSVSAALASTLGTGASLSLGVWKELSDSGAGGSGFSLVDLAADRSGAFCAQRGSDAAQAAALQHWLARATEADLLPVAALALAEGMTEDEFRARFTDTESTTFAATVRRIDRVLAVRMQ